MRFASMLLLFCNWNSFNNIIAQTPPQPEQSRPPTPPVGVPIDDYLIVLFILGLALGIFVVLKQIKPSQDLKS